VRSKVPDIPDFTNVSWQAQRNEAQMRASILDGKGKEMPAFRDKINKDQARDLAAHVRGFAPQKGKPRTEEQRGSASSNHFDNEFQRLQQEMNESKKQLRELPNGSTGSQNSKPTESSPRPPSPKPAESPPRSSPSKPSSPAGAGAPADRELFKQHCVKCHGADGAGRETRRRQPGIPDFTDNSWQARSNDAQLLASILDGKGKEMPPWRAKISEEQAQRLLGHVRAFAPGTQGPSQQENRQPVAEAEESEAPAAAEPVDAEQPKNCFGKLIPWLGRFHPAAVHFPVALLAAAALAQLLRLATGKHVFDATSRFCLWFGALTAVAAAALGWFAGGFRLPDATWVLMTHRWLGTATVACAGVVLLLGELGRRPDRRRTRFGFRMALFAVAILVLATGFFGGAVVHGLKHYAWPP
jgi:mono/diheme cytochrome c family protein/uncharacterized membrane protein